MFIIISVALPSLAMRGALNHGKARPGPSEGAKRSSPHIQRELPRSQSSMARVCLCCGRPRVGHRWTTQRVSTTMAAKAAGMETYGQRTDQAASSGVGKAGVSEPFPDPLPWHKRSRCRASKPLFAASPSRNPPISTDPATVLQEPAEDAELPHQGGAGLRCRRGAVGHPAVRVRRSVAC